MKSVVFLGPQKCGKTKLLTPFRSCNRYDFTFYLADTHIWPNIFLVEFGNAFLNDLHKRDQQTMLSYHINYANVVVIMYSAGTFTEVATLYISKIQLALSEETEVWFVKNNDPSCARLQVEEKELVDDEEWVSLLKHSSKIRYLEMSTADDASRQSFLNCCKNAALINGNTGCEN